MKQLEALEQKLEYQFKDSSLLHEALTHKSFANEQTGSVIINLKYTNGDRVDSYGLKLVVYSITNPNEKMELTSMQAVPVKIENLIIGNTYVVEAYLNGIFADKTSFIFNQDGQKERITIPLSSGIKFIVLYNDNYTPIEGAIVNIKSFDKTLQKSTITDEDGETPRFWIQSTTNNSGYYIIEVLLGNILIKTLDNLEINSGEIRDIKIVTPYKKTIDHIIISLQKDDISSIKSSDGRFLVELYDLYETMISNAKINNYGKANFTLLKPGQYFIKVFDTQNNEELIEKEILVLKDGQIFTIILNEEVVLRPN